MNMLHLSFKLTDIVSGVYHRLRLRGYENSPGSRNIVPYTISAAVAERSSFKAVRIPSSTSGSVSIHEVRLG